MKNLNLKTYKKETLPTNWNKKSLSTKIAKTKSKIKLNSNIKNVNVTLATNWNKKSLSIKVTNTKIKNKAK